MLNQDERLKALSDVLQLLWAHYGHTMDPEHERLVIDLLNEVEHGTHHDAGTLHNSAISDGMCQGSDSLGPSSGDA
jgi:hypothetical protein